MEFNLSWVMQMGPKRNHLHPYKRQRKILNSTEEKRIWKHNRERIENADLEDYNEVDTSQGMSAASRSWKRQTKDSSLDPQEGEETVKSLSRNLIIETVKTLTLENMEISHEPGFKHRSSGIHGWRTEKALSAAWDSDNWAETTFMQTCLELNHGFAP